MKQKRELKWLLLLLLPIAFIPAGVLWKTNRTSLYYGPMLYTETDGERSSLVALSRYLQTDPNNTIAVRYIVTEDDSQDKKQAGKARKQIARMNVAHTYKEWHYYLSYNRRYKTLVKSLYTEPPSKLAQPSRQWLWQNVEESAIHRVVGPKIDFTKNVDFTAYLSIKLDKLEKYGATLATQTDD